MGREWPWVARIRWWRGLEGSIFPGSVFLSCASSEEGTVLVGLVVVVVDFSTSEGEGSGMSWNRCLSLEATISRTSANVTDRERSFGRASWVGGEKGRVG